MSSFIKSYWNCIVANHKGTLLVFRKKQNKREYSLNIKSRRSRYYKSNTPTKIQFYVFHLIDLFLVGFFICYLGGLYGGF